MFFFRYLLGSIGYMFVTIAKESSNFEAEYFKMQP